MILVTGGTGLVGAHLLLHLATDGKKVRSIYRNSKNIQKTKTLFTHYQKQDLFENIEWVEADILDIPTLNEAFIDVTQVFHCAAHISFNPSEEEKLRKTNIEGTANVVNCALDFGVKRFCHVSSVAALGDLKEGETLITEETEWNPEQNHSDYAITNMVQKQRYGEDGRKGLG
jgi:nucleoside-diphosphate-sugar epimerase